MILIKHATQIFQHLMTTETIYFNPRKESNNDRSTNMHIGYAPENFSVDYTYKE